MENENQVDNTEEVVPTATEEQVPSQEKDPVEAELERVEKPKRTKKEQLLFTKKRVEQQLKELGEDIEEAPAPEDERPLTRKEVEQLLAEKELKSAVDLAEEIEDDNEKKLAKHYLENVIKPSGNAQTDLRNARLMVNAVKNGQVAEEMARTQIARRHSSSASAPANEAPKEPELSKEDQAVSRGFGLTPEEVKQAIR